MKKYHRPLWFKIDSTCQYVKPPLNLAGFSTIHKDPTPLELQSLYRKNNCLWNLGQFNHYILSKHSKRAEGTLKSRTDCHLVGTPTSPEQGLSPQAKASYTVSRHHVAPLLPSAQGGWSCPWRRERKLSSMICRFYGHPCSVPLKKIYFLWGKKKSMLKLYQVKITLPMSTLCYLVSQLNTFLWKFCPFRSEDL